MNQNLRNLKYIRKLLNLKSMQTYLVSYSCCKYYSILTWFFISLTYLATFFQIPQTYFRFMFFVSFVSSSSFSQSSLSSSHNIYLHVSDICVCRTLNFSHFFYYHIGFCHIFFWICELAYLVVKKVFKELQLQGREFESTIVIFLSKVNKRDQGLTFWIFNYYFCFLIISILK